MHLNFNLAKNILAWYDNNRRTLPWRVGKRSSNLLYYRVLSEFMLQQTQVKTVIPYFERFIKKYPNIESLSKAREKNEGNIIFGLHGADSRCPGPIGGSPVPRTRSELRVFFVGSGDARALNRDIGLRMASGAPTERRQIRNAWPI